MNIYVGNLNHQTTEKQLHDLFTPFGVIDASKIITKEHSGKSRGYGFIEMLNQKEAETAIAGLNGFDLDGYTIVVKKAQQNNQGNNYDQNMF